MCTAAAPAASVVVTETGASHATLRYQPPNLACREAARTRRSSLPPDACTDACARHARTHNLQPTPLSGRLAIASISFSTYLP